jgi:hypothetical protein
MLPWLAGTICLEVGSWSRSRKAAVLARGQPEKGKEEYRARKRRDPAGCARLLGRYLMRALSPVGRNRPLLLSRCPPPQGPATTRSTLPGPDPVSLPGPAPGGGEERARPAGLAFRSAGGYSVWADPGVVVASVGPKPLSRLLPSGTHAGPAGRRGSAHPGSLGPGVQACRR